MKDNMVLVTGGAGYVGCVLVPYLVRQGYRVRVLDKLVYGDFGLEAVKDSIELVEGDIMNPPEDIMAGVDAVIHLAGVSSQAKAASHSPRYTDLLNHIGTEIMAKAAKAAGVERFIFASSCSIYCAYKLHSADQAPIYNEEDEVPMFGPYALSKRAGEEALFELADNTFQPIIFRKGTLFGFSPKMRYDLVLNAFTKDAFTKRAIDVHAGGEIFRPMVDIQDVVRAYTKALELPLAQVGGQIFNLLNRNQKIGELAEQFKQVIKAERGIDIDLNIHPFQAMFNYKAHNDKYHEVFGLEQSRPVADAILEIWDHLQAGHDFQNKKYYNDIWHMEALKQGII